MANIFAEEVGLFQLGTITGYNSVKNVMNVVLNPTSSISGQPSAIEIKYSPALFYNNGLFIGTKPAIGTPVVLGSGSGGKYYFVSFLAENIPAMPSVNDGELLIRANDLTKLTLDKSFNIILGNNSNRIHINTINNYLSKNFHNEYSFTQASRKVNGIIKRDVERNPYFSQNSKLENDSYDSQFSIISLDPKVTSNPISKGSIKNPGFVENREMIYEFQYLSNVTDEVTESSLYNSSNKTTTQFTFPNRRKSRADTLSLTLAEPNFLIETIKGTVVDIFGNILDLNRYPIPIGVDKNTIKADDSDDKTDAYLKIRELQRKSIAFHFELNARKDLTGAGGKLQLPDINSNDNYSRGRSRFFFDIDKEGQFKMNVPASSEKGNISLLTRYENYSTFGPEDNNNPNKLIYRDDKIDIYQDSFAAVVFEKTADFDGTRGVIDIKNDSGIATPIDRIIKTHIKHGTAYHDITATCKAAQDASFIGYQYDQTVDVSTDAIPLLQNIVSKSIITSGDNANAGGRSGQISLDGSLEFNIGANTVDRQSLWLDTAGGIVGNIGRDINDRSLVLGLDGDMFVQIGGYGVAGDSRFGNIAKGFRGGTLDIRVVRAGYDATMVRIDKDGVKIMTAGRLSIHSNSDMVIKSDSNMTLEAETITMQGRQVLKVFGGSI